ncbi:MAG: prohibitin family protein [Ruminococcaceae bacterium]|nr:prohibitin family protein [Oscillospiraceae bacterium]
MAISIISGIAIVVLIVALVAACVYFYKKSSKTMLTVTAIAAVVLLAAMAIVPMSFHTVETGEVVVVKHLGEAKYVRNAGTYFDLWITNKCEKYDAKVQNVEITTSAYSSDAQTMDIAMTLQYQIMTDKVINIAQQYGSLDVLQSRIQSIAIEKTKSVLSSYKAMDIISDRASMSPRVEEAIKSAIAEDYHVTIATVVLTNIDFSDAFETAVEDKMIAEQKQLQAEYENMTKVAAAEAEAKAAVQKAEGEAQAKLIAAQADRAAQVELARAEAQAIQLKSVEIAKALGFTVNENTVTDEEGVEVIEYVIDFSGKSAEEIALITDYLKYAEYLAKWDGKLPEVMTGESATIMIPAQDNN